MEFAAAAVWIACLAGIYFLVERRLVHAFLLATWCSMGVVVLVLILRWLVS